MKIVLQILLCAGVLSSSGCATIGETLIDSVVCSLFDSDRDRIDPYVLRRKGIEPGSKEHKRLEYHEKFSRDFYRD